MKTTWTNSAAGRLHTLLRREPGIFSRQEEADLRKLLDEHADDFAWTEWAVQVRFPGGVTTISHDTEADARDHHRQLLAEETQRADRIDVVSRTNVQGTWRPAADDTDTNTGD